MVFIKIFIVVALVAGAYCQVDDSGKPLSLGHSGTIYSDDKHQVTGWGAMNPNPSNPPFSPNPKEPPIVSGGVDWKTDKGHGSSFSITHQPKRFTQGTIGGTVGLIHTPQHQLSASLSHTRALDRQFSVDRGSYTPGLGYQFNTKDGLSSFGANAQTTFGRGIRPIPQVGLTYTRRWR